MTKFIDLVIDSINNPNPDITPHTRKVIQLDSSPLQKIFTLIKLLENFKITEKFQIGENNITSEGGNAIANLLSANSTLTYLDLGASNVTEKGGVAIAESLKNNHSLTFLHLGKSNISLNGGLAIAEMLKVNDTLEELYLGQSNVSVDGSHAIIMAIIEKNTALKKIDLGGSAISPETLRIFAEYLRTHERVISLDGFYCNIQSNLIKKYTQINQNLANEEDPIKRYGLIVSKRPAVVPSLVEIGIFKAKKLDLLKNLDVKELKESFSPKFLNLLGLSLSK